MGKTQEVEFMGKLEVEFMGVNLRGRIYGAMRILFKRWEILYEENFLMLQAKNFVVYPEIW